MAFDIGAWRFGGVIMLAVAWIVLVPVLTVCYFILKFYLYARASGSAGMGAVSVGVSDSVILGWLLTPVVFVLVWSVLRRRYKPRPPG